MIASVILDRMRSGLAEDRFGLTDLSRETGIPIATLQRVQDGGWGNGILVKVELIAKALPKIDPTYHAPFAASFRSQPAFDVSRPVREQLPDVERDLSNFGVPVIRLCQRLGLSTKTWARWRRGDGEPAYSLWVKVLETAQSLIEMAEIDRRDARQPEATGVA